MNKFVRRLFCFFVAFSLRISSSGTQRKRSEERTDKVFRIPTLGRPALLGELYSAHADQFIPGFSLWSPEEIEDGTQIVWHPSSHTDFSADEKDDKKARKLGIKAHLKGSFDAGMITVEGSAEYLKDSHDNEYTASVTLSFMSIARTESLASNLLSKTNEEFCDPDHWKETFTDETSQPTHVVASVTYGGNCHLVFHQTQGDKKDILNIIGDLKVHVVEVDPPFIIDASANLNLDNSDTDTFSNLKVTMYSDFLLEDQALTFNDTLKIYRDISQNFGTKDSLYNQSVPMFVTLIPIKSYCSKINSTAIAIGKDILKRATNIRVTLMKVLDKITKLLTSSAALGNFEVRELLLGFESDVSNYTLSYEAELQKLIIGARNPDKEEIQDSNLRKLIDKDTNSPYNYNKHLYKYLSQRTRQVNALNIFYTQSVSQNEPQIAVYTKADVPVALITESVLFLLKLYVLPNVTEYNYTQWTDKKEDARWYSKETTVGDIGNMWRDFRTFFHLNGYQEGQNFFILMKPENSTENKEKNDPMKLELFIDGFKTHPEFQLRKLLKLTTNPKVCRTSNGTKLSIHVKNPPSFPTPNTISQVLVSLTKLPNLFKTHPESTSHYTQTIDYTTSYTSLTIPNLVPEYTYNVTVAFTTEYGSLTPSKVFTREGIFDKMIENVGCGISRNRMKENITKMNLDSIPNISASDCAHACHIAHNCSYGWTFQLSTGNCYFNKAGTNSTQVNGWAVGTQSCDAVKILEDDCKFEIESVLFLDAYNIFDLPSFKKRDCSVLPYPGDNYGKQSVSGMMNGILFTCGGRDENGNTGYKACFSLENGMWVKKSNMLETRAGFALSPTPKNANDLLITGGVGTGFENLKTTEILTPGEPWTWAQGPVLPTEITFHCQVTLGSTVLITGGWHGQEDGIKTDLELERNNTYFLSEDNNWSALPDMNQKRYGHTCAVLDNTVYVMAGVLSSQTAEKYKLGWKKWEYIDNLPANLLTSAFVFEDKLNIIIENGSVYSLRDEKSWDKVTNMEKVTNIETIQERWPSQILTASSLGC